MRHLLFACVMPLGFLGSHAAMAQAQTDSLTPTIPETQLEPVALSSPYEFLSVATSASDFVVETAALAIAASTSEPVKSMAARLSANHAAIKTAAVAAGQAQSVEIAKPAMDGEQAGLLGKLQPLKGADMDSAYVESQLFAHQRTIAYYQGYAQKDDALGSFARQTLPTLVADYGMLMQLAKEFDAEQPAAQQ